MEPPDLEPPLCASLAAWLPLPTPWLALLQRGVKRPGPSESYDPVKYTHMWKVHREGLVQGNPGKWRPGTRRHLETLWVSDAGKLTQGSHSG